RQQVYLLQGKPEDALLQAELGRGRAQVEAMRRLFKSATDKKKEASQLSIDDIRQLAQKNQSTLVFYSIVHPTDDITRARMGAAGKKFDARKLIVWVMQPTGKLAAEQIDLPIPARELVRELREEIAPEKAPPPAKDESKKEEASDKPKRSGKQDHGSDKSKPAVPAKPSVKYQRLVHDLLWKPIADQLPKDPDATVVIVPHGELFAVPFGALLDEVRTPLIARHTLVTTASLELYRLALERRESTGDFEVEKVLVVGNPKMPSYKFRPDKPAAPLDPLPGSEREANVIASMFGIDPLIGEEASEDAVKEKIASAPVIHMATHGLLEADTVFTRSYLSSLALAPDADSDGFLTVREVMAMDLKAELAVLSACDSGRGTITGDGVVGLSRAFLAAGVPNVVVSLWPVSDQATAFMMVRFYEALGKGKSKAAALRSAILATREQAPNPRLWAPFLLYGAGN
ncbi:MAG: CHAT domain-containing protein, partial [Planctomycetota bacterium]